MCCITCPSTSKIVLHQFHLILQMSNWIQLFRSETFKCIESKMQQLYWTMILWSLAASWTILCNDSIQRNVDHDQCFALCICSISAWVGSIFSSEINHFLAFKASLWLVVSRWNHEYEDLHWAVIRHKLQIPLKRTQQDLNLDQPNFQWWWCSSW